MFRLELYASSETHPCFIRILKDCSNLEAFSIENSVDFSGLLLVSCDILYFRLNPKKVLRLEEKVFELLLH